MRIGAANPRHNQRPATIAVTILAGIWCVMLLGCEVVGAPFVGLENRSVPAEYELPAAATVVIVEPLSRSIEDKRFARQVSARIVTQLEQNLVEEGDPTPRKTKDQQEELSIESTLQTRLIADTEVARFQDQAGDDYYAMAIDRLGRELGAYTVVYAKVHRAELNVQGSVYQPEARLRVRVVDARTGARLWPENTVGMSGEDTAFRVDAGGVHQTTSAGEISGTTRDRVWTDLADDAGLKIARLFYTWQRPAPGAKAETEKRRLEKMKRTNEAAVR